MLTRDEAQQLLAKILKLSTFPDCEVYATEEESSFVRFANNGVTTAGFTAEQTVVVNSTRDGRRGTSQTTQFDDESLRAAVKRSEELAAIAPPNPEYVDPLGPQKYPIKDSFDEATAAARSDVLIPKVRQVVEPASKKKLVAAGFARRIALVQSIANKRGNFGWQRGTQSEFATTVRTADGSSSGWGGETAVGIGGIDGAEIGARAIRKCEQWRNPVRLEPGKYTVVLEAAAVGNLLDALPFSMSARMAEEGRSFLSRKGGGTLAGEKLFPDLITLRSDPFDARFSTSLWGADGMPNRPMTWVDKGVVKNLGVNRYWATKTNQEATPMPVRLILEGSNTSLDELIGTVDRGLLVTRFWYVRFVNPQTVQLTGLTRDGLFLIEKGKVTTPVVNFRFNDSPVRMLQNTRAVGRESRPPTSGGGEMIVPPLAVSEFNFTSISDAV